MVELYYEIGLTINELIEKHNLESSQNEIIKIYLHQNINYIYLRKKN